MCHLAGLNDGPTAVTPAKAGLTDSTPHPCLADGSAHACLADGTAPPASARSAPAWRHLTGVAKNIWNYSHSQYEDFGSDCVYVS